MHINFILILFCVIIKLCYLFNYFNFQIIKLHLYIWKYGNFNLFSITTLLFITYNYFFPHNIRIQEVLPTK